MNVLASTPWTGITRNDLEMISWPSFLSLVPRPCVFVTCSTKFVQKAWFSSSDAACCSSRHDRSTEISDVIDELAHCLALKEASQRSVMVHVRTYLSAKGFSSERAQAAIFSWIADIYFQIPWPHHVTRSNLDSSSSSFSSRVYCYGLS